MKSLFIFISALLLIFSVGEGSLRAYHYMKLGTPIFASGTNPGTLSPVTIDDTLGWRATEGFERIGTRLNADGTEYDVAITQDDKGFRMFGDVASDALRIFVIGDSYTHAQQVSNDKTYYAVMEGILDAEIFAYGVGGYGTLQEYMVLEKYIDLIKPSVIVWQYCLNDFINNSPQLSEESTRNNSGLVAPFWVDGDIKYQLTKPGERLRKFSAHYSRLMYFTVSRIDRVVAMWSGPGPEEEIPRLSHNHQGFQQAKAVTNELMEKVRVRAQKIPIVAFSCRDGQPYTDAFHEISLNNNVMFLEQVALDVKKAEEEGLVVRVKGEKHWNEIGHQIVGEILAHSILQMNLPL